LVGRIDVVISSMRDNDGRPFDSAVEWGVRSDITFRLAAATSMRECSGARSWGYS